MNLLVSDFDGTLNPMFIGNIVSNLDAVSEFRKQGNLFMLSTGRSFDSIKKQIDKYHIKYDYLSCNDGGVLFDKNNNLISYTYMSNEIVKDLRVYLDSMDNIMSYSLYGPYGKTNKGDIIEFAVNTKLLQTLIVRDSLKEEYPELNILTLPSRLYVETIGGKSRAIDKVLQLEKIDEVFTVGDSFNDIDMLQNYNGFRIFLSSLVLTHGNMDKVFSVKHLVKKINML